MAEESSWDADVARHQVYPAMLDVADQVHAYPQHDADVLDYIQNGLGKIAYPLYQKAQQFYRDKQQWASASHAEIITIAGGTLAATDTFIDQDDSAAAGVRRAGDEV
jgi:hypothetical protein